jgi:putative peptidoglycan lipid II flippase
MLYLSSQANTHTFMVKRLFGVLLDLIVKRQTNILSAAFVIMATVVLSQILGLIRQRLLVATFGASNTLGVYLAATKLPDFIFQLTIAAALSSAFIPVFSDYLAKGKHEEANKIASTVLIAGLFVFLLLALVLSVFAPYFLQMFNLGSGFSPDEMALMTSLMRIIIIGQLLFIGGTFFSALLQSHNHFFVPGIAAAMYNLGMIVSLLALSPYIGIHAAAYGVILGSIVFILMQIPLVKRIGFRLYPDLTLSHPGVKKMSHLMWPRTLSMGIFQVGTLITVALFSFLPASGRNFVIFDYAQTLAFAPVVLFGQTIAQATFPVLAREKDNLENFKIIFLSSFTQMLYLILPVSALILVLRIPIVRLVYGASQFDWDATVLTGRTLALFSVSIFSQGLIALASRAFYALHDTKIPLIVGAISTLLMLGMSYILIIVYGLGVESIAISYSIASIINLLILLLLLSRKLGGFDFYTMSVSLSKFFIATLCTAVALYVPIKLLDQVVFDTTRTIELIFLTGISTFAGLSLYLFLTWLLSVKEANTYLSLFKRIGSWKDILHKSDEILEPTRINP